MRNKENGLTTITLSGAIGTDGVLDVLHSYKVRQPDIIKNHAETALNRSWETMMRLMQQGGAINLEGDILQEGLGMQDLPLDRWEQLQKDLVIGVTPREFTSWTGKDAKMPKDWDNKDWGVHIVIPGFEKHLGYSMTKNNRAQINLVLPNGHVTGQREGSWLRRSFAAHLAKSYAQEEITRVVEPGVAVTQLMVDIATTFGCGRIK